MMPGIQTKWKAETEWSGAGVGKEKEKAGTGEQQLQFAGQNLVALWHNKLTNLSAFSLDVHVGR